MKNIFEHKAFILIGIIMGLFIVVIVNSAWLSDDSFISLSQIINLQNGEGIVFNFEERVQAFTHPSWFFLLSLVTYLTGDYYYTILTISIMLSTLSLFLIFYFSHNQGSLISSIAPMILLLFSKAFIDYTTSGLENPLSYFLFGVILIFLLSEKVLTNKYLIVIYVVMAFLFLNRMDYALILIPIVLCLVFTYKNKNILPMFLAGGIVVTWFLFSLFYFGHFLPNTYYAKLLAGYPIQEYLERGMNYYVVQFERDPITLVIILTGILLGFLKKGFPRAIALGIIVYLLYFFKSGGDFMQGRFFAVPTYISIFLIISYLLEVEMKRYRYFLFFITIVIFSWANTTPPLFSGKDYQNKEISLGIGDERGFYFPLYGLISDKRQWPDIVTFDKRRPMKAIVTCGGVGRKALSLRNKTFIIDNCALIDPLLSQLPASQEPWRIGHQVRKIPTNYLFTRVDNSIPLGDSELNNLYKDIKKVTTGNLLSLDRLKAIYRINTFHYDINLTRYENPDFKLYISTLKLLEENLTQKYLPPIRTVKINNVKSNISEGMDWNDKECHRMDKLGLSIMFEENVAMQYIKIGLDSNDAYLIRFMNEYKTVKLLELPSKYIRSGGIGTRVINLKEPIVINKIEIIPFLGDARYSLGYLKYE